MTDTIATLWAGFGRGVRPFGLVALVSLAACGGQPFEYTAADEIPPGPGLFSGPDGAFTYGIGGTDEAGDPEAKPQEQ
jgi:hypothetical protein